MFFIQVLGGCFKNINVSLIKLTTFVALFRTFFISKLFLHTVKKAMCCNYQSQDILLIKWCKTCHAASHRWGTRSTDDRSLGFQIWRPTKFYWPLFGEAPSNLKVFLNFLIIYKSYKCYSMTNIHEICWSSARTEKLLLLYKTSLASRKSIYHTDSKVFSISCTPSWSS